MENNNLKEKIQKNVKEKIAISNIREEFNMKNKNNSKVLYGILSVCAVFVICFGIIIDTEFSTNTNNLDLSKGNSENQNNIPEDRIIFNEGSLESIADYDAKWQDANLKEEFNFIEKIVVPNGLYLCRQGKIFVRENINIAEYSKLKQYSLIYSTGKTEDPSQIEIIFTKEQTILGCMLPREEDMESSIINGKEVKLFKGQYGHDRTKIVGDAFFEKDGYKFYINVHKIDTEEDFINIVKSILNN